MPANGGDIDPMASLLQVKDLAVHFYTREDIVKAVDGISYDLKEGETMGLVGESGCGKTVSALALMGLIPSPPGRIEGGQVLFEGRDLRELSASQMRSIRGNRIAMVFQEPMTSLNPALTIGRQLTEVLELHLNMSKHEARTRAVELLQMVDMPDPHRRVKEYPHQLSGGMRQRVMIAMAMSCNPKLLIADEPTTALDVTIQAQIMELMKKVTQEFGTALIIITHNLGLVARYADRVCVMYAGKIVERGSTEELYDNTRHPYTVGLLHSVPRLDVPQKDKLTPIQGAPPDLIDLPTGCSFRPRCPYAIERCAVEDPPLMPLGADAEHVSACWVADTLAPTANRGVAP